MLPVEWHAHESEKEIRGMLSAYGYPLVLWQPDGHVLVCKSGTWADGKGLLVALEELKRKLEERKETRDA